MENKTSQQQNMEHLIQKYKVEAMKFRQRYSDLYPEQIPATEVSSEPFSQPPKEKTNDANTGFPFVYQYADGVVMTFNDFRALDIIDLFIKE